MKKKRRVHGLIKLIEIELLEIKKTKKMEETLRSKLSMEKSKLKKPNYMNLLVLIANTIILKECPNLIVFAAKKKTQN